MIKIPAPVRNDKGVHEYGNCEGCSKPVRFWFVFKVCDDCMKRSKTRVTVV